MPTEETYIRRGRADMRRTHTERHRVHINEQTQGGSCIRRSFHTGPHVERHTYGVTYTWRDIHTEATYT